MNCEKCQALLSDFLDGTLTGAARVLLSRHLRDCVRCADVRDDLSTIVATARSVHDQFVAPPSSRALWLRINNTLEAERAAQQQAQAQAAAGAARRRQRPVMRLLDKRWSLSLPQLSAAVAALVVVVATATAFSVQSLWRGARPNAAAAQPRSARRYPADQEVDLLMARVAQRKARWNPRLRDAFERNLQVLDTAVNESLQQLSESPHDEVSEDALDAAMRNKKELLREFADL